MSVCKFLVAALFHYLQDFCGCLPVSFLPFPGYIEIVQEKLFLQRLTAECFILFRKKCLLVSGKPIDFAFSDSFYCLRVYLRIIQLFGIKNLSCHFHTQKTTASCRVIKQIHTVTGSYERGITTHRLYVALVRCCRFHNSLLQNMLQIGLLALGDGVELIEIDKTETRQVQFGFPLAAEVQTISIIVLKFRR